MTVRCVAEFQEMIENLEFPVEQSRRKTEKPRIGTRSKCYAPGQAEEFWPRTLRVMAWRVGERRREKAIAARKMRRLIDAGKDIRLFAWR